MTKNKYKKPQSSPNQARNSDRTEGPGRGGRGRGRGGRGGRGAGMNDNDYGGGDDPFRRRGGFRGGGPPGSNFRSSPPPFAFDRGSARGRGRGRGGQGRGFGGADSRGFTGNSRGGRPMYHSTDEIDFEVQQWNESPQSGRNTPGGRGRGSPSIHSGNNTPRGRGERGGRGGYTPKLPPNSSLSSLWHEERPLLRPIKFIRSVETATLFQEAEELLEPTAQTPDQTAESHVPTADKVSRVFSTTHPHLFENSLFEIEEGIEEVNFEDLALVHERVLVFPPTTSTAPAVQQEVFTGISQKPAPELEVKPEETPDLTLLTSETTVRTETATTDVGLTDGSATGATTEATQLVAFVQDEQMDLEAQNTITAVEPESVTTPPKPSPLFVVDTDPSTSQKQIPVPTYNVHPHTVSFGESVKADIEAGSDPEDDVIVYVAPNPRISTPRVELTTLTNISLSNHTTSASRQINPLRRSKFVHAVGKNAKRGSSGVTGVKRKRLADNGNFAAFGAMIAEARLRSQDDGKDPKEHLRRQGDSDLDWGDETDEGEGSPAVATAEGMDIDPDLVDSGVAVAAMERFVEGINGNNVTMDDLEDANVERYSPSEDEMDEEDENGTDGEDVEGDEERMLIEGFLASQDGADFSDEDEDELDPRAGFQARLDRLRKKQHKLIETGDGEEDEMDSDFEWGEGEDIDDFVNEAINKYEKNQVARNAIFRAIQDGYFDELQPKSSSSKRKDLPAELVEQWEKDRLKKAKRKSERELARLETAVDPDVTKKGGKKSKKAMIIAAARPDASVQISHRIVDMNSVEQQIRRFLADKERAYTVLPACDRSTRKKIHHLAALFGLSSKSKDGALGRYTTLSKMDRSGKNIDERKVVRMMEGFKYRASYDVSDDDWDGGGKGKGRGKGKGKGKGKDKGIGKGKGKLKKEKEKDQPGHLRTKEGDVVGHAAPKIDETNIGFMMLASMGWSNGAAIGSSGGLDAPITAVIKKTRLGLGASVSTKF